MSLHKVACCNCFIAVAAAVCVCVCVCLREREKICACDEKRERCQNKFCLFFFLPLFSLSLPKPWRWLFSFSLSLSGNPTQFTYIPGRRTKTPRRQPASQAIVHNSRTILNFAALPIQIPAAPTTTCLLLSVPPCLFFGYLQNSILLLSVVEWEIGWWLGWWVWSWLHHPAPPPFYPVCSEIWN